jgi:hypothetical protein
MDGYHATNQLDIRSKHLFYDLIYRLQPEMAHRKIRQKMKERFSYDSFFGLVETLKLQGHDLNFLPTKLSLYSPIL